jgi:hypothetical protein
VQQITEYLFLWGKIPLSCPKSSRKIVYKGKSILLAHKYMTIHFPRLGTGTGGVNPNLNDRYVSVKDFV